MNFSKYLELFRDFMDRPDDKILIIYNNQTILAVEEDIFKYMLDVFLDKYPDFDILILFGHIKSMYSLNPSFILKPYGLVNMKSFIINKKYVEKILNNQDISNPDIYYIDCMKSIQRDGYEIIMRSEGGLGNLIFQYCFCKTKEIRDNAKLKFIIGTNYWRGDMSNHRLFNHLDFINESDLDKSKYIDQGELSYYYTPLMLNPDYDYIINGYFQSYKHFIDDIEYIKSDLFRSVQSEYQEIQNKYKYDKPTCLIHVRRGDYLKNPEFHVICPDYYYSCGVQIIKNLNKQTGIKFLIFSDDIEYVKNMSILQDIDYEIIDVEDPDTCFMIMTTCDNFIIANSSLSLLGYLFRLTKSESCRLIAPSRWYNRGPDYKLFDLIPNNALIIHV
jgi:hypothetical protein